MQKVTKNVDALGFDKWQIADVRRAYASNKTIYTKMSRLAEKINNLAEAYNLQKAQLEAWEGPVKIITQKVLGMELTSQEVLAYHKEPKLFADRFPEHPATPAILEAIASGEITPSEPSEEPEGETAIQEEPTDGTVVSAESEAF